MNFSTPILEIDLTKIRNNYNAIADFVTPSKLAPVVKANGYGLGANEVANALISEGCKDFFVATATEGINLRKNQNAQNINIFVLHGVFKHELTSFIEYKLIPVINHLEQLAIWQDFAVTKNQILPAILHVNTGIHRLGMPYEELQHLIANPNLAGNIKVEYIISHLSCSDEPDNPYNSVQLAKFKKILQYFPGIQACFANSDGVFLGKEYHFDMVRVGAGLYGINSPIQASTNPLAPKYSKPVKLENPVKLSAPIIQIQNLASGLSIGYNAAFTTKTSLLAATIPLGYADGYLRQFGKFVSLFIENYQVFIIGKISMDLVVIDVTTVPKDKIFLGQMVEVIGDNISPYNFSRLAEISSYEILTLLGNRYHRIYK